MNKVLTIENKQSMKKIISFFILSIALFACQMAEPELKPNEYLKISRQIINFDEKAAYGYIGIESNATWSIECAETWLDFSATSGTGDDLVKVFVEQNISTDGREATVVVKTDGGSSKNVFISQNQLDFSVQAPSVGVLGREITLDGSGLFLIDKVLFGSVEGVIVESDSEDKIEVTIPENAQHGEVELKVIYDNAKEMTVGMISLLTLAEVSPKVTFPERVVRCAGEILSVPCTFPEKVLSVDFVCGSDTYKGEIVSAVNETLTVNIPASAPQGIYDMKITYDEGRMEAVVGTFSMALDAGDYYMWDNVTIYAQNYPGKEEKVFCLETGMMVSIDWVYEHKIPINLLSPGSDIGTMQNQPRGYHYLMLKGDNDQLRLINPNSWNYLTEFKTSNGSSFAHYELPQVRFSSRLEKDPYQQHQAYPAANKGNTTHTPGDRQKEAYNAIKSGRLTISQWNAVGEEFGAYSSISLYRSQLASGTKNMDNYGHATMHDMRILFDNYTATINPAGTGTVAPGTKQYWNTVQQARDGWTESFHGGVVLWTANYGNNGNINHEQAKHLNGALHLLSWTGEAGAGATTGSMTMQVYRKKVWDESHYSYNPNL